MRVLGEKALGVVGVDAHFIGMEMRYYYSGSDVYCNLVKVSKIGEVRRVKLWILEVMECQIELSMAF